MNLHLITRQITKVSNLYAKKFDIDRDLDWYLFKLQEELGELTQSYLMLTKRGRSKGKTKAQMRANFEKEFADVFCHVLLFAQAHNIDVEKNIHQKWLKYVMKQTEEDTETKTTTKA